MIEELFVGWAKVVQTPFSVRSPSETMLGAFSVTGEAHAAITAIFRQCVALGITELLSHWAVR